MSWRHRNVFHFAVALTLLSVVAISARPANTRRVPGGSWGGPHIQVSIEGNQATIEYDCAHGSITGPFTVNSRGVFNWRGTHSREHGGPIRINEKASQQAAIYTGSVNGSIMTLTVKLVDTGQAVGTYTLTRGRTGRIFKCR